MGQQELINHESDLQKAWEFQFQFLLVRVLLLTSWEQEILTIYYMKKSSSSSIDVNVYFQSCINFIIDPKWLISYQIKLYLDQWTSGLLLHIYQLHVCV